VAACNIAHQAKIVSCAHIVSVMLWCCAMLLMFLKQKLAVSCLVIYTQQNRQLCSKVNELSEKVYRLANTCLCNKTT